MLRNIKDESPDDNIPLLSGTKGNINDNKVEPLNKGHIGTCHFILCREVVLSLEVKNVLAL